MNAHVMPTNSTTLDFSCVQEQAPSEKVLPQEPQTRTFFFACMHHLSSMYHAMTQLCASSKGIFVCNTVFILATVCLPLSIIFYSLPLFLVLIIVMCVALLCKKMGYLHLFSQEIHRLSKTVNQLQSENTEYKEQNNIHRQNNDQLMQTTQKMQQEINFFQTKNQSLKKEVRDLKNIIEEFKHLDDKTKKNIQKLAGVRFEFHKMLDQLNNQLLYAMRLKSLSNESAQKSIECITEFTNLIATYNKKENDNEENKICTESQKIIQKVQGDIHNVFQKISSLYEQQLQQFKTQHTNMAGTPLNGEPLLLAL